MGNKDSKEESAPAAAAAAAAEDTNLAPTTPAASPTSSATSSAALNENSGDVVELKRKPSRMASILGAVLKVDSGHSDLAALEDMLSSYFEDMSLPTLTSGLLLLSNYYKPPFPPSITTLQSDFRELWHYARVAVGIYGWKLLAAWTEKAVGTTVQTFVTSKTRKGETDIKLFKEHIGISDDDFEMIDVDWHSHNLNPAHIFFVDKGRKEVIIAIRGTMDMHDVFTDLVAQVDDLEGAKAHRGMLLCARKKFELLGAKLAEAVQVPSKYPTHRFVVTGHSLGAAAACLLTVIMRKAHPNVDFKCYGFGTPAAMDLASGVAARPWMTSVICRYDVIPRLSEGSIFDLKDRVKYVVNQNQAWGKRVAHILTGGNLFGKKLQAKAIEKFGDPDLDLATLKAFNTHYKLYPPGRIVYLYQDETTQYCADYTDSSNFDEIIIYKEYLSDHFPDNYERVMSLYLNRALEKEPNTSLDTVNRGLLKNSLEVPLRPLSDVDDSEEEKIAPNSTPSSFGPHIPLGSETLLRTESEPVFGHGNAHGLHPSDFEKRTESSQVSSTGSTSSNEILVSTGAIAGDLPPIVDKSPH